MPEHGFPALLFNDSKTAEVQPSADFRTGSPAVGSEPDGSLAAKDSMFVLLSVLSRPWTLYLAWKLLSDGPMRFSELRESITGISSKVLVDRLRMLEAEQLVARTFGASVPARRTYEATHRLRDLMPILLSLRELAAKWYEDGSARADGKAQKAAGKS
jgi:DNA-binding HxlR family transcriptional regulator